jgi:hypothetical protein
MFEIVLEVFKDNRLGDGVKLLRGEILEGRSLLEELLDYSLDVG